MEYNLLLNKMDMIKIYIYNRYRYRCIGESDTSLYWYHYATAFNTVDSGNYPFCLTCQLLRGCGSGSGLSIPLHFVVLLPAFHGGLPRKTWTSRVLHPSLNVLSMITIFNAKVSKE